MAEHAGKPEVRFAGFTEAWEQRKVADEVDTVDTGKSKFRNKDNGEYEILGSTSVIGYSNEYDYEGDFLLTARVGANAGTLYRRSGKVKITDNTVFLQGKNLDFLFYLLSNFDLHKLSFGTGQPLVKASELKSLLLSMPRNALEKKQIGTFFRHLDRLITLHQRKRGRLENIKKAMLEKMFPKNGADVPEVRFAGFTEAWEQRELGDLVTSYADPVPTPTNGYYRLGIRSHAKGTFHNYVRPGMELGTAQMHRVAADNFIVNITFGWEHAVAITDENDAGKLVSHRFPQFRFNTDMVPDFFKFVIMDEDFRHHLWLASPGGAGRNRVLKIDEMLEYKFWVPSADEQRRIAVFLERLDRLITLHQRKVALLQNIKKACLEKMFV